MFEGILQPTHLILILIIVLVVFGPGKLPEIGGALGKGLNEFKRSVGGAPEPEKAAEDGGSKATDVAPNVCQACGAKNPAGNQFCGSCGAKIAA